ncbi:MAG: ParA family protein [Ardenticatenales bacterium]
MHVLAIVNQKGGVGKTTTAVNLGASLALAGHPTLVIDADPQANATRSLDRSGADQHTLYDVLVDDDVSLADVIVETATPGLFVAPSSTGLAGAEVELVEVVGREGRLRRALDLLGDRFAFVLIDCPPSLSLLSVNALVAAEGVIVPVQCEYLSLEGLGHLNRTLQLVQARLNPRLQITGLLMTMFDPRTNLSSLVVEEVGKHFPRERFTTVIPRSIRLGEAPSYGETIHQYSPNSPGALAYRALAGELAQRLGVPVAGSLVSA